MEEFAKVMVEIDLSKPLIEKIWIDFEVGECEIRGFWQKIWYEFVPLLCGECSRLEYSVEGCRRRKSGEDRLLEVVVAAGRARAEKGVVAEAMVKEGRRRGSARLESQHGEGEEGFRREMGVLN
nr:TMV resistance protein N-like [Ipomoea batatas]